MCNADKRVPRVGGREILGSRGGVEGRDSKKRKNGLIYVFLSLGHVG